MIKWDRARNAERLAVLRAEWGKRKPPPADHFTPAMRRLADRVTKRIYLETMIEVARGRMRPRQMFWIMPPPRSTEVATNSATFRRLRLTDGMVRRR